MKIFKIIITFIGVLLLVFFSTGLIVKETQYTTKVEINKPITEVFSAFIDQDLLKEWIPEIESIETIVETPNKIGSKYKMVVINEGEKLEMLEEVLEYELNKKMTLSFTSDDMLKTDAYSFINKGNTTLISKASVCKSNSYIMSCMFPYFKGILRDIDQGYLDKYKKVVEKQ